MIQIDGAHGYADTDQEGSAAFWGETNASNERVAIMSLYNQIFGVNHFAPTLLAMLDVKFENIVRFRDCYLDEDGLIVIYTRTGGMNRKAYESANTFLETLEGEEDKMPPGMIWNQELRFLPGYVDDMDDGYDATFAKFRYRAMSCFQPTLHHIGPLGATMNPGDRWAELFASMAKGECNSPAAANAAALGDRIVAKIEEGLASGEKVGVIEL